MQFLIYLFFWSFIPLSAHPFHVSVCDLYFNDENRSVEITHKIFLDDLENALKEKYDRKVNLLHPAEAENLENLISGYIGDNFTVVLQGKKQQPRYLGHEIQDDAIWCYQEIIEAEEFTEITVKNTVLLELFNDQTNLVHVKKGKRIKSLRLHEKNKKGTITFKK